MAEASGFDLDAMICAMEQDATTGTALDELHEIAANISRAVMFHDDLTKQMRCKVLECFAEGQGLDMIARNANLSPELVKTWRGEWVAETEEGRAWLRSQTEGEVE